MKKLLPAYILCFVFCFMLFIYEPIIMYATNLNDFWFNFDLFIKPVLEMFILIFLGGSLVITFIYFIFDKVLKKTSWFNAIILIGFIVFLITYIQGNYLVGRLPGIDGSVIDWSIYRRENYITLGLLLIIISGGGNSLKEIKTSQNCAI